MPRQARMPPSITVTRQPKRPTRMLHRGPVGWRQERQGEGASQQVAADGGGLEGGGQ